ncbi:MAG: anaerobic benzoate catabolism transcriptional regulator [Alphaproteobacteria bacterium ADurb.Bin438]|nr:MAG: anaerobic benzoate catabolism transcriptional regulator [Alphaproteobacteria bacterium ADurb.Bin438]
MEEIIFPNQIRTFRRLKGVTMQELADFLNVSLSAVSKIEKGYRRIDQEQLLKVADYLDCPANEIFVSEDSSQPEIVQSWKREQERRNMINEHSGLKTMGAGLRYIRSQMNLTLIEVADNSDMTLSVYHRIEMGQREVSEEEFNRIARALNFSSADLQRQIYTLDKSGALNEFIQSTEIKYTSGPKGGVPELPVSRVSDKKEVRELPVYGRVGDDGLIMIDEATSTVPLMGGNFSCDSYGINFCTRRLGTLLPARSILVADPSKVVGTGDIAVFYENDKNVRILAIREDDEGKIYGLEFNPERKIYLDEQLINKLHRIVYIYIS